MNIVRIWLYKTFEDLKYPDAKISETNQPVVKKVRGDFVYYEIDGESVRETTRRVADEWSKRTGRRVETWRGYPAFMHDQGYRA